MNLLVNLPFKFFFGFFIFILIFYVIISVLMMNKNENTMYYTSSLSAVNFFMLVEALINPAEGEFVVKIFISVQVLIILLFILITLLFLFLKNLLDVISMLKKNQK